MTKKLVLIIFIVVFAVVAYAATDPRWSVPISMNPVSPSVGNNVQFTATFWVKVGGVDNLKIIGGVDGTTIFTKTYAHCDKGYLEALNFSWVATAGSHKGWFQIDPDKTTPDSDQSNNRTEISFTVGGSIPTDKPNLQIPTVTWLPKSYKSGDALTLSYIVSNTGGVGAGASKAQVKVNGITEQTDNVPALAAGASKTFTFNWTVVCEATIKITADYQDVVVEGNEADNTWTRLMTCKSIFIPKLDLRLIPRTTLTIPLPDPPYLLKINPEMLSELKGIGGKLNEANGFGPGSEQWLLFVKNHPGVNFNEALDKIFQELFRLKTRGGRAKLSEDELMELGKLRNQMEKLALNNLGQVR